jgi:YVTN family beta-propeller protein
VHWRVSSITVTAAAVAVFLLVVPLARPRAMGGAPVALVTAETADEVLAVSLPDGKVLRRVRVHDPQAIAAQQSGPAVVVSPSGAVTLLAWHSLRVLKVFRSFRSPQIGAIIPSGKFAYVTDAATGRLTVIDLARRRIVDAVSVGSGAHHLAISPDGTRTWVALGENASTIVILDSANARAPRVTGEFHPAVAAHDLVFSPDGRTVWVSSSSASYVSVLDAHSAKVIARVPAGVGPQHVTFFDYGAPRAIVTSGYGSTVETVNARTHRVISEVPAPYGSFNVSAVGGLFATSSLLTGQVAEFALPNLERRMTRKVAPATRDLAVSVWP